MAETMDDLIIVRDAEGRFYAFTPEQWAEAQVPDDVQAALAEVFDGDDTQGLMAAELHMLNLQSVVSQRNLALQMVSSLLSRQHQASQSIANNIGR